MFQTIRRGAATMLAACAIMPVLLSAVTTGAAVKAADPPSWPVSWDLNRNNDVEELSRLYDRNEDGVIDADSSAATDLPAILNAQEFSLHAKACAAPKGFVSIDWQLVRLEGGDPLPVYTSTECEIDIPLPDKPYPEARKYDLRVVAHYPTTPDQVVTSRVHVQDVFMVGLGDSYGSGEGNPTTVDGWFTGGDPVWDNTRCHRSRLSGQEQAARMLDQIPGVNVTFLHLACSGALASEGILQPYAGLIPADPPLPPQITQANEYVQYSTDATGAKRWPDLVVTSIGGNDAGFSTVVKACLKPAWVPVPIPIFPYVVPVDIPECYEEGQPGTTVFKDGLELLPGLYDQIDQAVHGTNPELPALCDPNHSCKFLITEYPDGATDENGDTCSHAGFTEDEFQWVIDHMVTDLNTKIREKAQQLGWNYVLGVRSNFDRHGICAEDDYFRDIFESVELQNDINGAFHPNAAGHLFGYAPAIAQTGRYALGFPYSWGAFGGGPLYGGSNWEGTCDTTYGDGRDERFTAAPPVADLSGLHLPAEIASQLTSGQLPSGAAGSNTCASAAGPSAPPGSPVLEIRTGRPGCPNDPRPCSDSSAGSSLLRFPLWTDAEPAIVARADSDVARSAGQLSDDRHRHGSANAQGRTAFLAAPFNGSATVTGEIVVDLTAFAQAGGSNAYSLASIDLNVNSVTAEEDCSEDGTECLPQTTRQIGRVQLELNRGTCEEDAEYLHDCELHYGHARAHFDSFDLNATAGDTTIADLSASTDGPQTNVVGSPNAVTGGVRSPSHVVRLPYSVPAGSVVTIQINSGAYTTASEGCVLEWNNMPCSAQARAAARVTFAPNIATGALLPLSGYTATIPDTTAPAVTATPTGPAGTNGWYIGAANVALGATDDGGVAKLSYTVDNGTTVDVAANNANVAIAANGTHVVKYWATDLAGNASAPQSITVKVDVTAPTVTVTATNGAQYIQGTDVPSGVQCADLLSGIATCDGPVKLDTATTGGHTAAFTATDAAGNTATTSLSYTVVAPPPPPPPPPPATTDAITLSIPELNFNVSGNVVSGGFTITRSAAGQPTGVYGTAVVMSPSGTRTTVSVAAFKVFGVWAGATSVSDPAKNINVNATLLAKSGLTAVGAKGLTGTFTSQRPTRTVTWTITDLV